MNRFFAALKLTPVRNLYNETFLLGSLDQIIMKNINVTEIITGYNKLLTYLIFIKVYFFVSYFFFSLPFSIILIFVFVLLSNALCNQND